MEKSNGTELAIYRPPTLSPAVVQVIAAKTPPEEIKLRQGRGGQTFKYVDTPYIIELLNKAFAFGWSFETENISPWELISKEKQVIIKGRLTVHGDNGAAIVKEQFGSAEVKMLKDGTGPVDVADDFKAAASDALKKCASLFGIAADVYSGGTTSYSRPAEAGAVEQHADYAKRDIPSGDWEKKPATDKQINMLRVLLERKKIPIVELDAHLLLTYGLSNFPAGLLSGQVTHVLEWLRQQPSKP